MSFIRKTAITAAAIAAVTAVSQAQAGDWQKQYPTLTLGVITSENEADRIMRYQPVRDYFERTLGVEIKWRTATDYAGIVEGVKAGKIEIARFGPASYAKAWMVTKGAVEPLVGELDNRGIFGYHAVVVVKTDSPYKSIDDLKGRKLAFADPNSTSGHQAPRYFLGEAGYDADKHFGETGFSGSHENSVMALLNGTFDAAATWWRNEEYSNPLRMEMKGMIEPGQWRIVWKSPKLPSSPWAMSTKLPDDMRRDVQKALLDMKDTDPKAWTSLTMDKASGFRAVTHEDYEGVVRMIKHNLQKRRDS
ncbi:MAG: phosphonate ABC transporter substrate-binding protein [Rhodospirillales bacterium]|nr:phosphonate ABC transporter substrate-binding protein [Rhodospirillales bacterium]